MAEITKVLAEESALLRDELDKHSETVTGWLLKLIQEKQQKKEEYAKAEAERKAAIALQQAQAYAQAQAQAQTQTPTQAVNETSSVTVSNPSPRRFEHRSVTISYEERLRRAAEQAEERGIRTQAKLRQATERSRAKSEAEREELARKRKEEEEAEKARQRRYQIEEAEREKARLEALRLSQRRIEEAEQQKRQYLEHRRTEIRKGKTGSGTLEARLKKLDEDENNRVKKVALALQLKLERGKVVAAAKSAKPKQVMNMPGWVGRNDTRMGRLGGESLSAMSGNTGTCSPRKLSAATQITGGQSEALTGGNMVGGSINHPNHPINNINNTTTGATSSTNNSSTSSSYNGGLGTGNERVGGPVGGENEENPLSYHERVTKRALQVAKAHALVAMKREKHREELRMKRQLLEQAEEVRLQRRLAKLKSVQERAEANVMAEKEMKLMRMATQRDATLGRTYKAFEEREKAIEERQLKAKELEEDLLYRAEKVCMNWLRLGMLTIMPHYAFLCLPYCPLYHMLSYPSFLSSLMLSFSIFLSSFITFPFLLTQ